MNLKDRIEEAVNSGQSGMWIRTHEPEEVIFTCRHLGKENAPDWDVKIWNCVDGVEKRNTVAKTGHEIAPAQKKQTFDVVLNTLLDVISVRANAAEQFGDIAEEDLSDDQKDLLQQHSKWLVVVISNAHLALLSESGGPSEDRLTKLQLVLQGGRTYHVCVILLSFPTVNVPLEVREQLWIVDHELPDEEVRKELIEAFLESNEIKLDDAELSNVVQATGGLTRNQVEGVCAIAVTQDDLDAKRIWELKADTVNSQGLLRIHRGTENFKTIGGYQAVKDYTKTALTRNVPAHVRARAMILLGIPGVGKSAICKALGNEVKRPVLFLDIGSLMGSFVGQTEERTREALRIADAMAPCILFVDEIEKALGGGDTGDSGVTSRLKGAFLTWMNDHTSDVFFVATANDISRLPGEFVRSERVDSVFFMELPNREAKTAIWKIYRDYYGIKSSDEQPDDRSWTGAEIKACCRQAALLGKSLIAASKLVVPVTKTAVEQISALRSWAHNRCIDAETGEVYVPRSARPPEGESDHDTTRRTRRVRQ